MGLKWLKLFLLLIFIILPAKKSFSQTTIKNAIYFSGEKRENFITHENPFSKPISTITTLRPVGWSRNGKFAYITEEITDNGNGTLITYIIFDAVDDTYIDRLEDYPEDREVFDRTRIYEKDYKFISSFSEMDKKWNTLLDKYEIDRDQNIELRQFPLIYDDFTYIPSLEYDSSITDEEEYFHTCIGCFKGLTVYINKKNHKKRIHHNSEILIWNSFYGGYFISPYEKRILVLIGIQIPGAWTTVISFIPVGCHLIYGF